LEERSPMIQLPPLNNKIKRNFVIKYNAEQHNVPQDKNAFQNSSWLSD